MILLVESKTNWNWNCNDRLERLQVHVARTTERYPPLSTQLGQIMRIGVGTVGVADKLDVHVSR